MENKNKQERKEKGLLKKVFGKEGIMATTWIGPTFYSVAKISAATIGFGTTLVLDYYRHRYLGGITLVSSMYLGASGLSGEVTRAAFMVFDPKTKRFFDGRFPIERDLYLGYKEMREDINRFYGKKQS